VEPYILHTFVILPIIQVSNKLCVGKMPEFAQLHVWKKPTVDTGEEFGYPRTCLEKAAKMPYPCS
jgi:hypothetical protein